MSGPTKTRSGSAGAGSINDTRVLWSEPENPHTENDEFNSSTLNAAWVMYSGLTDVAGTINSDTVDTYDTTFNSGTAVRINANPIERKSWALLQPPAIALTGPEDAFVLNKPYTLPTNVLIWTRLKFSARYNATPESDGIVGIALADTATGLWDKDNQLLMCLQEPDVAGATQAEALKYETATPTSIATTNNLFSSVNAGQALEYAAIHKIGSNYHAWVGTSTGQWIWMGTTTLSFTPDRIGIVLGNSSTSAPGVMVHGVDFIRFLETDKFPL